MAASIELFEALGFIVNQQKSILKPTRICPFLGFNINSVDMSLELPGEKRESAKTLVEVFSRKKACKIREFARFLGTLVAYSPALEYSSAYLKAFQREIFQALLENGQDYEATMRIPISLREDFDWWKEKLQTGKKSIASPVYVREIFSDASLTGWGAHCNGEGARGFWKESEKTLHINYLELTAAFIALRCFCSDLRGVQVLLRVDNTTAISYINRMGGVQYPGLVSRAKELWKWCEARQIRVFASYIKSASNSDADRESRNENVDTEWELANFAFEKIVRQLGEPAIDLFATRANTKCEVFCAWHRDPEASAIDAFTITWKNKFFYAFPPFAIIPKVLQKIIAEEACGILVVPDWPNQPWYPLFFSRLCERPIYFNPSHDLLLSPCRSLRHPLARNLRLIAGKLSGTLSRGKVYRNRQ